MADQKIKSTKPPSKGNEGCLVILFQICLPISAFILMYIIQRFAAHVGSAFFAVTMATISAVCIGTFTLFLARHAGLRGRILAVVLGYIVLVFLYGTVYQIQFQHNPSAFLFNGGGQDAKAQESFHDLYKDIRIYNSRLYYLSILEAHPKAGVRAVREEGHSVSIDNKHTFEYDILAVPAAPTEIFFDIYEDGKKVLSYDTTNPIDPITPLIGGLTNGKDIESFLHCIRALIEHEEGERTRLLAGLKRAVSGEAVWDFMDFVYFSSVTMTTLGYGDILPNSRLTRMTVMSQTIFGICYLGFALAFIWPKKNNDNTT